jgi:hypothetical protein
MEKEPDITSTKIGIYLNSLMALPSIFATKKRPFSNQHPAQPP